MKTKKLLGILGLTAVMSAAIGFGMHNIQASAESTVYTSTEKDYWMFTSGSGDYTISLDNPATCQSAYVGVETVITPAAGVKDVGITLKALVDPMKKMIIYHDNQVSGVADADAIVYSYTSLKDPDRQISVIATNRGDRTWYTLALTDQLAVSGGYTYIAGTEYQTLGKTSSGAYTNAGTNYNYNTSLKAWGAIYQSGLEFIMTTDGEIKYNNSISLGNVTNTEFLATSKTALAGTKYEERYTPEYVAETLAQLATGARMEIKYYGVKSQKVDFHIRGINGSWIADNGGKGLESGLGLKHSVITYKKLNTLYVGETYKLSDLVYGGGYTFRNAENTSAALNLTGWYANSVNKTADNNEDSTWYKLSQMSKTVTMNEEGTYNMTLTGSMLGYWLTADFTKSFTFDVVNKTPVTYQAFGETVASFETKRWTDITMATPTEEQLAAVPAGFEFAGWEMNGNTYAAGSTFTVNGDGNAVVFNAKLSDVQKPTITAGDYTGTYYEGDELTLLPATVSDNSGEAIEATVSVSKNGESVAITDNKVALSKGTYTIVYTAKDSAGNEADAVTKTVVVKGNAVVKYINGDNVISTESYQPGQITLATFNAADAAEGYVFAGWAVNNEVYEAGANYNVGEEDVTFVAQFNAIEYTATLDYIEEGKVNETVTFTIENRDAKLAEIIAKLPTTNDGYGHSWKDLPTILPLENVTYVEVVGAIVYTITFEGVEGVAPITFTVETKDAIVLPALEERVGYTCAWSKSVSELALEDVTLTARYVAIEYTAKVIVNGTETEVTYTIEDREDKLVEISNMKPKADTEYYNYVWENPLPEELPLANGAVYTVVRQDVVDSGDSSNATSSDEPIESTGDSASSATDDEQSGGCSGTITGLTISTMFALGAVCLLKKKED